MSASAVHGQTTIPPRPGLEAVAGRLVVAIEHELAREGIPSASIALIEGGEVVWARGFGKVRPGSDEPATARTVGRAGSVSKLFTDIALMQLVERGEVDIDAPVTRYLPDFAPKNKTDKPITLRQLMAHRSGLCRESPVGNYFDHTSPSLADTVKSLNSTALVFEPEEKTKYSNAGVAVVGRVIEVLRKEPFAETVKKTVLDPVGMELSGFDLTPALDKERATGIMWSYDGRVFEAPTFALGTSSAGNLYSTALDLGRFVGALLEGGKGRNGKILDEATLKSMWTPQFAAKDAPRSYGLGFNLSRFQGRRRVGHGGAVYGFATDVSVLPDDRLGVVVFLAKDCANATATRISDLALGCLLVSQNPSSLPAYPFSRPVPADLASRVRGRYTGERGMIETSTRDGRLFLTPEFGGFRVELRSRDRYLVADDSLGPGAIFRPGDRKITSPSGSVFTLEPESEPPPPPAKWKGLIGEYGWDHNTLFIHERGGKLFALIEWFFVDPLEELGDDLFRFPESGLYGGETLRFQRGKDGRATGLLAAFVQFPRRKIDGEGTVFRIEPVRPLDDLRKEALAATPPLDPGALREADLVDVTGLEPGIKLDIRYASTNNFLSTPFYSSARAFLQRPAAEALVKVHRSLATKGYGLLIHDAYRPWYVTKMFWDATPPSGKEFVANPALGSKHNRGCAVDLTLYRLSDGKPVEMVGGYDEFSDRSRPEYMGGTSQQRWRRDLLRRSMEAEGFRVNEVEWWHFDYRDWARYPVINKRFEEISARSGD